MRINILILVLIGIAVAVHFVAAAESKTVHNKEEKKTGWSDIEYLSDANNDTMVNYKNLFGLNIGKVYNPNFVDDADWFLDSKNYEDHVDYYLIPTTTIGIFTLKYLRPGMAVKLRVRRCL